MKRTVSAFIICLIISAFCVNIHAAEPADVRLPATADVDYGADTIEYPGIYGRLVIPSADINVGLYCDSSQYVCDRPDSACFFPADPYRGMIIADHNTQEFSNLTSVSEGDVALIIQSNGSVSSMRCTSVFDGHNTGQIITDGSWNNVMGTGDYLTYTCLDNWHNVCVCLWDYQEYA